MTANATSGTTNSSGLWSWNEKTDSLHFEEFSDLSTITERYINTNGYRFIRNLKPEEEEIFRREFVRTGNSFDEDTVVSNDVRDLVLFLMPKEFLNRRFLKFMHKPAVHNLLHSLIIYFEYFLRLVEFILICRDDLEGTTQSEQSIEVKRYFATRLSQYRILVARAYSIIIKGEGDMAEFYHMRHFYTISSTTKDKRFHDHFLAVLIQIIWITMHRRAHNVIEMEMNRLFYSDHFIMDKPGYMKFTPVDRSLLYGRNYKIVNYLRQVSPLIQELSYVSEKDLPILWIGVRKYRGTDLDIAKLELEFIVPGQQLALIDVTRGIIGHPKRLYDISLHLSWPAVRLQNYTLEYDPYHIIRQPSLQIPSLDEAKIHKVSKHYEHLFNIYRIYEPCSPDILSKWINRENVIKSCLNDEDLKNIYKRCEMELNRDPRFTTLHHSISKYFKTVRKLRKGSFTFNAQGWKDQNINWQIREGYHYFN